MVRLRYCFWHGECFWSAQCIATGFVAYQHAAVWWLNRWAEVRLAMKAAARKSGADSGAAIVVLQDFPVSLALGCHDCGANLTQSDTVSPSGSSQDKAVRPSVYDKCRAVKMRAR